ncbi:hypothetical protein, partial [Moorena sp. SIO4G3]|uniref:hypothetical protein n=1 Tax=Moorena sp. SIO4G3 TaxID=2607821 RepID=UPI00142A4007
KHFLTAVVFISNQYPRLVSATQNFSAIALLVCPDNQGISLFAYVGWAVHQTDTFACPSRWSALPTKRLISYD